MPTYYPINETLARQANMMNSCYAYKPGSATAEYRAMVDKATAIAEEQKSRTDLMYHEKIDRPLLTPEDIAKLEAEMARSFHQSPKPYESFLLSNNNAEIHRLRARITELEQRQTAPAPEGWAFNGGKVVMNREENRVQIIFDGKPDADVRAALKRNGFRWTPSQGAWQRMLNQNGFMHYDRVYKSKVTVQELLLGRISKVNEEDAM